MCVSTKRLTRHCFIGCIEILYKRVRLIFIYNFLIFTLNKHFEHFDIRVQKPNANLIDF